MSHSILIVDDHPIFRQGLVSLLEDEENITICGEADDHCSALKLLKSCQPDLITLDLNLKTGSGLQLLKQLRAHNRTVKILVTSMHDDQLFAERCIHAGANGYINKEEASTNIIKAIQVILQGGMYLSDSMLIHLAHCRLQGVHSVEALPEEILSNRELEVFMLIGKGISTQNIARELHLSSKTIDTHKEHIKKKLGVKDNTSLIQRAVSWSIKETII